MKIAVITNFDMDISPASTGGTEVFIYHLVTNLAKKTEIEVIDVYGVGKNYFTDKKVSYISLIPTNVPEFMKADPLLSSLKDQLNGFAVHMKYNIAMQALLSLLNNKYDIIHNNGPISVFNALAGVTKTPTITTLHTNNSPGIIAPYSIGLLNKDTSYRHFIAVSEYQHTLSKKNNIDLPIRTTIHNGIPLEDFDYCDTTSNKGYALWIGRTDRKHDKGLTQALELTRSINVDVKIMTFIEDKDYYETEVKPLIHSKAQIIPYENSVTQKKQLLSNASYVLYPLVVEEAFGLVFIEAMASGTPVIAYARGAVPEIIKDGSTGFIVNPSDDDIRGNFIIKKTGLDGLKEAIERITTMDKDSYQAMRKNCLEHEKEHFTAEKMAENYLEYYKTVLNSSGT